jgi:hypothetical protein
MKLLHNNKLLQEEEEEKEEVAMAAGICSWSYQSVELKTHV